MPSQSKFNYSAASVWLWLRMWRKTTRIARPPRRREEVPVQLFRLLDAHQIIIRDCRDFTSRASRLGDDGTSDLICQPDIAKQ